MIKKNNEFIFCGASRPLYFIKDNELVEYKSTIYSVGGHHEGKIKDFKDEVISYRKGDSFYISSDGFADQFGGPKNKRYSTRKMKNFLLSNSTHDCEYQLEAIDVEFENWKGEEEQIDDVLVIGVKL